MISREADFSTKEEDKDNTNIHTKTSSKPPYSGSTSWSRLKDPRIVRVSRAFGGKDRHSKVCTVRGLRDRRVRLSVPTAIQLYDLQDRLGLNQPSKVVDWLLNAAKHEIDGLPPLQMPPGNFPQNLYPSMFASSNSHQSDKGLLNSVMDSGDHHRNMRDNAEDVNEETNADDDKDLEHHGGYASSNNFFQKSNQNQNQNQLSFVGLMNNTMSSYNSFMRWDPSNLSLSHGGSSHGLPPQPEELGNFNMALSGSSSSSLSSQVVVYPTGIAQCYFPNSNISASAEFDHPNKHMNLQMLNSSSQNPLSDSSSAQPVRPFHFSMMANLLPSNNNNGGNDQQNNKDDDRFDSR